MSYPAWPTELDNPLIDGFTEGDLSTVASDPNDYGFGNDRPLTTKVIRTFQCKFWVNQTQKAALETFHTTTIGKTGYFYWTHPLTSEAILVKMPQRPTFSANGPYTFIASCNLQEI